MQFRRRSARSPVSPSSFPRLRRPEHLVGVDHVGDHPVIRVEHDVADETSTSLGVEGLHECSPELVRT